jgi:DNA-binding transcriptional LysR family regulator
MSRTNTSTSAERLDSELLRTFLAVAESGSVSRGANRIFRSQSAASLQIKRLESLLGGQVFERHGRGVALTSTGENLLPIAQRVVRLLDGTLADLKAHKLEGSLRIGIPDEYGATVLPQVVAKFVRDNPRVELAIRCALSAGFPDALARGELDIAVYDTREPQPDADVLRTQRTVWATARNHRAHQADPLPLALFDRACWWRALALDALRASGRRFRIVYTSESVAGVVAAVEAGAAVGLLGEGSLQKGIAELTSNDGFPAMPSSNLVLACRNGPHPNALRAMAEAIRAAFGATRF